MPKVTTVSAGRIIGRNAQSLRRYVKSGLLQATTEGLDRTIWIDVEDLRKFAMEYNYRFDKDLAQTLARN